MKTALHHGGAASSDAELIHRILNGDLEALGSLFDRHERAVRRFLARLGMTGADLDDVVQNTFLEVVRAAKSYDGRCAAGPWLFGVAARMTRRHRRSFARMAARLGGWAEVRAEVRPETPVEAFEGREAERRFAQALARLSAKKREVFVMVTLEGASGEDAAAALGVPINTVWTRLHHAREELRENLGEDAS